MNILAIGAHFDDIEIGCGGALAKYVRQGHKVYVFVATSSGFSDQQNQVIRLDENAFTEARNSMQILGIEEIICARFKTFEVEFNDSLNIEILKILNDKQIDTLFTHWSGDTHHDHQAVAKASIHCCRHIPRCLMYRSNWYDSQVGFHGNFFIDITETWHIKEQAISAYVSEMERVGIKWLHYFKNEAENAGYRIGVKYAEAYEVVKWLE